MAFLKTEIITVDEVKSATIPDTNFDTSLLSRYIFIAQSRYIKPVLGDDFYEEMVEQVDGSTLTADNTALLDDWIKPALAYFVTYLALPQIRNEITEKGIMNNSSETSDASSTGDYASLRSSMLDLAQVHTNNITTFVNSAQDDDSTKYPLFGDCGGDKQFGSTNLVFY